MRKVKVFRCPICKKPFKTLTGMGHHMDMEHSGEIPKNWSYARYYYYVLTGRKTGSCIVCKSDTLWNEKTQKYDRFCQNPNCKQEYRELFKNRMINKYGKVTLLDDPEQQRKMLKGRKISGTYTFAEDKVGVDYVGSYEKDFLMMMDKFLQFKGADIMAPSPHTYTYVYNGEEHFYIPDFFIPNFNLEIEIKDSTNKHHKIIAVDRVKDSIKDGMMKKASFVNYLKLTDKNYKPLFEYLLKIKNDFEIPVREVESTIVKESDRTHMGLEEEDVVMETYFNSSIQSSKREFLYKLL